LIHAITTRGLVRSGGDDAFESTETWRPEQSNT